MLDQQHEFVRAEAAAFAQKYLAPYAEEVDRTGEYRPEVLKALAEAGYTGLVHPK